MIELMSIVALVVGLFLGWFVFSRSIGTFLTVTIMWPYLSKRHFMSFYELADDEVSFKFMVLDDVKTYADYLRLHESAKKSAYKRFRHIFDNAARVLVLRLLPIALLPAIIFWTNWYWYILGELVLVVLFVVRDLQQHHFGIGFYQRVMLNTVLSNYLKDRKTKDGQ